MTVYDTPGIASSLEGGREDEQKAFHVAQFADLLIFLFSDDAPQHEEAKAFAELKQRGKPMLAIINCKSSDSSRQYSKIRLYDIHKKLDDNRLDKIKAQFLQLAGDGDNLWHDVQFIYTDLHTAFLSRLREPPELAEHADELYALSRFAQVEEAIVKAVMDKGEFYQYRTFIDIIYNEMWMVLQSLNEHRQQGAIVLDTMARGKARLDQIGQRFKRDAENRIRIFVDRTHRELQSLASSFAESNYDNDNAKEDWRYEIERQGIGVQAKRLLEEVAEDCESRINEFSREFSQTISFRMQTEVNGIQGEDVTDYGHGIRIGIALTGIGIGIIAAELLLGPVGWVLAGISFLTCFFTSKEEQIRKAVRKMHEQLNASVDSIVESLTGNMNNAYRDNILNGYLENIIRNFQQMQDNVKHFVDLQKNFSEQINGSLLAMNGQLLEAALNQVGLSDTASSISRMARIPGEAVLLEINAAVSETIKCNLADNMHNLLQEELLFISKIRNIRQAAADILHVSSDAIVCDEELKQLTIDISKSNRPLAVRCLPELYGQLVGYNIILKGSVITDSAVEVIRLEDPCDKGEVTGEADIDKGSFQEESALSWYTQGADYSQAKVQWDIAVHYFMGVGTEKNYVKALQWAIRAAEQRLGIAQCFVGDCCFFGIGRTKNQSEAVKWYELAEEAGYSPALKYLGDCYYFGDGVKQDSKQAADYYQKAVDAGYEEAAFNLGNAYYLGEGRSLDYVQSARLFRTAAENGQAGAQNNLGNCYYLGLGVSHNFSEAHRWYTLATENGSNEAAENLATF